MAERTAPKSIFHQMATASWLCPLLVVAMNVVLRPAREDPSKAATIGTIMMVVTVLLWLLGLGCGIGAFFGIPKYGRKGILLPALIGTGIIVLLVAVTIVGLTRAP